MIFAFAIQVYYLIENTEVHDQADINRQEFCIHYCNITFYILKSVLLILIGFIILSVGRFTPIDGFFVMIFFLIMAFTYFLNMPYCLYLLFDLLLEGFNVNSELSEIELK